MIYKQSLWNKLLNMILVSLFLINTLSLHLYSKDMLDEIVKQVVKYKPSVLKGIAEPSPD